MNIAKFIDHTSLKPDVTFEELDKLCEEAKEFGFYSVCVNSYFVPYVKEKLINSDVKITSVIGFPLGAMSTASKKFETEQAIKDGANEIDMVINVSLLKANKLQELKNDIQGVRDSSNGAVLKVILENCLLTKQEIVEVCKICKEVGVDFVKTSTGFSSGGATVEDVKLMKETVGNIGVKASGGVRDFETAMKMIEAGATRIGASASVNIVKNNKSMGEGY